jgi:general secretion pathway protein A
MIKYRLDLASEGESSSATFSFPALWAIYRASKGYPRKIINICHRAILTIIIQNRTKVDVRVARFSIRKSLPGVSKNRPWIKIAVPITTAAILLLVFLVQGHLTFPWKMVSSPFLTDEGSKRGDNGIKGVGQNLKSGHEGEKTRGPNYAGAEIVAGKGTGADTQAMSSGLVESKKVPDILGRVAVSENDTLGAMIYNVYGVFNEKYLGMITDHNNEIKNPDFIESGQEIEFPAAVADVPPSSLKSWWVLLSEKSTLEDAYGFTKDHSGSGIQMAIIPNWNSSDGLKFSVLYRKSFADEKLARSVIGMLPGDLSVEAGLKNGWAADTIFFASPVFKSSQ